MDQMLTIMVPPGVENMDDAVRLFHNWKCTSFYWLS